jgi:branched-chain amino acid transport system permease protein
MQTSLSAPYVVVLLGVLFIGFLAGAAIGEIAYRPFQGSVELVLVSTIAIALLVESLITEYTGGRLLRVLSPFGNDRVHFVGISIPVDRLWVASCAALFMLAFYLLMQRTRLGLQLRASAANSVGARLVGLNVTALHRIAWGLGGSMAAVAGLLIAPSTGVDASMVLILIRAVAGAIIGGFESLLGAVVGGVLVGLLDAYIGYVVGGLFRDVAVFGLVVVFMILFPRGIFRAHVLRTV